MANTERMESAPLMGEKNQNVRNATIEVRMGFVKKVYGIVTAQLCLTALIATPIQHVGPTFVRNNMVLYWVALVATIACICTLTCCQETARTVPINYILLLAFTCCFGVLVGFITALYTWQSVLLSAFITIAVVAGLTIYAWTTKTDFTGMGPYLMGALLVLTIFSFVLFMLGGVYGVQLQWLYMVYNFFGVMLFTMYIIYDTQLILGEWGGHEQQFGIDDYVIAALNLYLDIINLFLFIVRIIGQRQ